MSDIASRLSVLRDMRRKHVLQLRLNLLDAEKDKNGSVSNSLIGTLRFLAVAGYVSDSDITQFRVNLSETVLIRVRLFERFDSGDLISPSYVSMMSYKVLLNALAAGDEQAAVSLASRMGGRTVVEREYDRPFDIAFGYALRDVVLSDFVSSIRWVDALSEECRKTGNADFRGYSTVLHAILKASQRDVNAGLEEIISGHGRQCKGKGLFKDTEDELLCVWGVAVANLARMRGLQTGASDPLIPADLLI